jgi:hypothetical protein
VKDSTYRLSLKTVEATLGGAPSLRIRPLRRALYSLPLEISLDALGEGRRSRAKHKKSRAAGNKPDLP